MFLLHFGLLLTESTQKSKLDTRRTAPRSARFETAHSTVAKEPIDVSAGRDLHHCTSVTALGAALGADAALGAAAAAGGGGGTAALGAAAVVVGAAAATLGAAAASLGAAAVGASCSSSSSAAATSLAKRTCSRLTAFTISLIRPAARARTPHERGIEPRTAIG